MALNRTVTYTLTATTVSPGKENKPTELWKTLFKRYLDMLGVCGFLIYILRIFYRIDLSMEVCVFVSNETPMYSKTFNAHNRNVTQHAT